jgi:hypothetical protein
MALALTALPGLDRALALSPQTNLSEDWRLSHNDSSWEYAIDALHQTIRPRMPHDIKDLISASRNSSEYHVVYANGDELDVIHANRLEACRNTYLYGLNLAEHNSASALHESGSVNAAMREVFGLRSIAERDSAGLPSEPRRVLSVDEPPALTT